MRSEPSCAHPLPPTVPCLGLAGVALLLLGAGGPAYALHPVFGLWFTQLFVFLGPSWVLLRLCGLRPVTFAGLASFSPRAAGLGFLAGALNYAAWAVPLMSLAEHVFPRALLERFDGSAVFRGRSAVELALVVAGVTVAAPLCEELFFRGLFQRSLERPGAGLRAVGISALVFSALHFDPVAFAARFELGLLFGLLALWSRSLWPAVLAHAASNAVSTGLYFLGAADGSTSLHWTWALAVGIAGNAALLPLLWWLRRQQGGPGAGPTEDAAREAASAGSPSAPPSFARVVAPWLAGALGSIALLMAIDGRGVRLRLVDLGAPLSPGTPAHVQSELAAARARAERGEDTIEAYERARRKAAGR